jgi:hypothetical protein
MKARLPLLFLLSACACAALATFTQGAELPKKPLHQQKASSGDHLYGNTSTSAHRSRGAIHYPSSSRHRFNDPRQPSLHSFGPAFMR